MSSRRDSLRLCRQDGKGTTEGWRGTTRRRATGERMEILGEASGMEAGMGRLLETSKRRLLERVKGGACQVPSGSSAPTNRSLPLPDVSEVRYRLVILLNRQLANRRRLYPPRLRFLLLAPSSTAQHRLDQLRPSATAIRQLRRPWTPLGGISGRGRGTNQPRRTAAARRGTRRKRQR